MGSQGGTQDPYAQAHLQSISGYIAPMLPRDDAMLENLKVCKEELLEAAQLYKEEDKTEVLKQLRPQLLALVEAERRVEAHKKALGQLQHTHQPSLQRTDFAATLQSAMQALSSGSSSSGVGAPAPEEDGDVREFDEIAGVGPGGGGGGGEMDDDDELLVMGGADRNEKCPYTLKPLLELQEPVEDQKGFVYEGEAVRAALQKSYVGRIECPVAGTSHWVTAASLKPSRRVLRLQKHVAKHGGATQHAAGGGATQHGGEGPSRVLDI